MYSARIAIIVSMIWLSIEGFGGAVAAETSAGTATIGSTHALERGIAARDLAINCPGGSPFAAELVPGAAGKQHAGLLFVHWLGSAKTTNHTEFEPDAAALARRGATSLLVDAMWAKPGWFDGVGISADRDSDATERQISALRCALDVLAAQPGVDPSRIAYVGHDFGAMFGALVAGRDTRPRVFVLMAGTPELADWYRFEKKLPDEQGYRARIGQFDTLSSLRSSKAKAFLLQFSDHDMYIPRDRALLFAAAAPEPKTLIFYGADHSLNVPQARRDRLNWLEKQLD